MVRLERHRLEGNVAHIGAFITFFFAGKIAANDRPLLHFLPALPAPLRYI